MWRILLRMTLMRLHTFHLHACMKMNRELGPSLPQDLRRLWEASNRRPDGARFIDVALYHESPTHRINRMHQRRRAANAFLGNPKLRIKLVTALALSGQDRESLNKGLADLVPHMGSPAAMIWETELPHLRRAPPNLVQLSLNKWSVSASHPSARDCYWVPNFLTHSEVHTYTCARCITCHTAHCHRDTTVSACTYYLLSRAPVALHLRCLSQPQMNRTRFYSLKAIA